MSSQPHTRTRRTKIVATLGPSWEAEERVVSLLDAGVNIVRVNASHGTPEIRERWIRLLHSVRDQRQSATGILVDLHGPRIRVGTLPAAITIAAGQLVTLAPEATAEEGDIPTTYPALAGDVLPGSQILIDDGLLAIDVTAIRGDRVEGRVRYGGLLKSNKGMNLPGSMVSAPAVTEHDREEVERVVALGIEFIGVSFVRRPEDIQDLRRIIPKSVKLIAKIEKDTALTNLDGILEASDAIMVARGDLGVELPYEAVPMVQKRLIERANRHGKPVITATQMLESMVTNPRPTRAEVSDVANAILDGTDAVMLSAETAVGQYPLEAVLAMDRIAREVEHEPHRVSDGEQRRGWQIPMPHLARTKKGDTPTEDAIAVAVSAAADLLGARAIVCFTSSGFTARTVSSYRPKVPILALTPEPATFRQLGLAWGVVPVLMPHLKHYDPMWAIGRAEILSRGFGEEGSRVVVTCGVPFDIPGTTNLLKVETL